MRTKYGHFNAEHWGGNLYIVRDAGGGEHGRPTTKTKAEKRAASLDLKAYRAQRGAFIRWRSKFPNPSKRCHVKGRKVKGGRSVTLKNMASVTIIRRRNGTVGIRGVKA